MPPDSAEGQDDGTIELLAHIASGDDAARSALFEHLYTELKRIASNRLHSKAGHSLQTTELVHEAYMKLTNGKDASWQSRAHFCAVAATAMRQILVDRARGKARKKRISPGRLFSLLEGDVASEADPSEILTIDEVLGRLGEFDRRLAQVVELRVFGGLTVEESAATLEVSERTVKTDWRSARAWLGRFLESNADP